MQEKTLEVFEPVRVREATIDRVVNERLRDANLLSSDQFGPKYFRFDYARAKEAFYSLSRKYQSGNGYMAGYFGIVSCDVGYAGVRDVKKSLCEVLGLDVPRYFDMSRTDGERTDGSELDASDLVYSGLSEDCAGKVLAVFMPYSPQYLELDDLEPGIIRSRPKYDPILWGMGLPHCERVKMHAKGDTLVDFVSRVEEMYPGLRQAGLLAYEYRWLTDALRMQRAGARRPWGAVPAWEMNGSWDYLADEQNSVSFYLRDGSMLLPGAHRVVDDAYGNKQGMVVAASTSAGVPSVCLYDCWATDFLGVGFWDYVVIS